MSYLPAWVPRDVRACRAEDGRVPLGATCGGRRGGPESEQERNPSTVPLNTGCFTCPRGDTARVPCNRRCRSSWVTATSSKDSTPPALCTGSPPASGTTPYVFPVVVAADHRGRLLPARADLPSLCTVSPMVAAIGHRESTSTSSENYICTLHRPAFCSRGGAARVPCGRRGRPS